MQLGDTTNIVALHTPMQLGDTTNIVALLTAAFTVVLLVVALVAGIKAMKGNLAKIVTMGIGVFIAFGIARLATMNFDDQTSLGGQLLSLVGIG